MHCIHINKHAYLQIYGRGATKYILNPIREYAYKIYRISHTYIQTHTRQGAQQPIYTLSPEHIHTPTYTHIRTPTYTHIRTRSPVYTQQTVRAA